MKKHAKKSLLFPILALASVIAIVACCYLAQSFSAYAEEEPNLELKDVTATIHLSNDDVFSGSIVDKSGNKTPFLPTTEKIATFNDVFDVSYNLNSAKNECEIYGYVDFDTLTTYVINLPWYCSATNVSFNWIDQNQVDITVIVGETYFLSFDAGMGSWADGSHNKYVRQVEYEPISFPEDPNISGSYYFVGWFTDPIFGAQVFPGTQAQSKLYATTLYAHYAPVASSVKLQFNSADFVHMFSYTLYERKMGTVSNSDEEVVEYGLSFNYGVSSNYEPKNIESISFSFADANLIQLTWTNVKLEVPYMYRLVISGNVNFAERITSVMLNGSNVSYGSGTSTLAPYNYFIISCEQVYPGVINVHSSDYSFFKCNVIDGKYSGEYCTSEIPIFVGQDEYAYFTFGGIANISPLLNLNAFSDDVPFSIVIYKYDKNFEPINVRIYQFSDYRFSLIDWWGWNSYIIGLSYDGFEVPVSTVIYPISNNWTSFELIMSNDEIVTTLTYDANGGAFAEGETSKTLDATYGEALPAVENPTRAENDFVGWFTDPEGGQQVDPANYQWNPWDRWNGVKLYAHWVYNPQPVPPEPVPPEPGPTPVDPDNPGGGGTAQTGDSIPLAPIAAFAVIAALGCALTLRKESSN